MGNEQFKSRVENVFMSFEYDNGPNKNPSDGSRVSCDINCNCDLKKQDSTEDTGIKWDEAMHKSSDVPKQDSIEVPSMDEGDFDGESYNTNSLFHCRSDDSLWSERYAHSRGSDGSNCLDNDHDSGHLSDKEKRLEDINRKVSQSLFESRRRSLSVPFNLDSEKPCNTSRSPHFTARGYFHKEDRMMYQLEGENWERSHSNQYFHSDNNLDKDTFVSDKSVLAFNRSEVSKLKMNSVSCYDVDRDSIINRCVSPLSESGVGEDCPAPIPIHDHVNFAPILENFELDLERPRTTSMPSLASMVKRCKDLNKPKKTDVKPLPDHETARKISCSSISKCDISRKPSKPKFLDLTPLNEPIADYCKTLINLQFIGQCKNESPKQIFRKSNEKIDESSHEMTLADFLRHMDEFLRSFGQAPIQGEEEEYLFYLQGLFEHRDKSNGTDATVEEQFMMDAKNFLNIYTKRGGMLFPFTFSQTTHAIGL